MEYVDPSIFIICAKAAFAYSSTFGNNLFKLFNESSCVLNLLTFLPISAPPINIPVSADIKNVCARLSRLTFSLYTSFSS